MENYSNTPRHLPSWAAGIAAILVSGVAIGSLAISARSGVPAAAQPSAVAAAPVVAPSGARSNRCAECGVIASMREIETADEPAEADAPRTSVAGSRAEIKAKRVRTHEIAIRMQDGSMRMITDTNPARWRRGERVILIAGVGD